MARVIRMDMKVYKMRSGKWGGKKEQIEREGKGGFNN